MLHSFALTLARKKKGQLDGTLKSLLVLDSSLWPSIRMARQVTNEPNTKTMMPKTDLSQVMAKGSPIRFNIIGDPIHTMTWRKASITCCHVMNFWIQTVSRLWAPRTVAT